LKKQYQYQDYPTACYQLNGLNNNQQNPINYPPPPSYPGPGGYQLTPPGLFGYSRPSSPTMNPMYPHSNVSWTKKKKENVSFLFIIFTYSLILIILDIMSLKYIYIYLYIILYYKIYFLEF
jgi:hypothetical protein